MKSLNPTMPVEPNRIDGRPSSLVGMVLAGGRSQRMGADKALLTYRQGKTWLEHAIDVVSSVCEVVVVSGRSQESSIDPDHNVVWLSEDPPARGPMAGLVATLRYAASLPAADAVLVIPVDMPALRREHLLPLVRCFQQSPDGLISVTFDGKFPEPLLAIYPLRFSAALSEGLQSGDRSLSRWLGHHSPRLVSLADDQVANINTPREWAAWQQTHKVHDES